MLPPQKPARLQQGGILVSSLGKCSLPWPLQTHWRQPAFRKVHGRPGVQNRRSRHRPTDKAALSRTMGRKTLHPFSPPPTSQRYTMHHCPDHQLGIGKKHTKRRLSFHPSPPVQGWGSRMDFLSSRHPLVPRGRGRDPGFLLCVCSHSRISREVELPLWGQKAGARIRPQRAPRLHTRYRST